MNLLSVVSRGIRDQLITHSTLAAILSLGGGRYKIFLDSAFPSVEPPYIRIVHMYGGDRNRNSKREFDITVRVDVVSRDYDEAEVIAGYIDAALVGSRPTLQNGWTVWTPIRQIFVFNDPVNVGNEQFFSMGGQFRVQGV